MTPLAYLKLIVGGGLLLAFGLFCRSCGTRAGNDEVSALKASHAQTMRGIAEQTAKVAELARKTEQAWGDAFIAVALNHQKELNDAKSKGGAVTAGVRDGSVQLRPHWTCPVPRAPEAPTGGRSADAAADDRAESAGRIVAAAATCDAQVRGLQAVLIAERE